MNQPDHSPSPSERTKLHGRSPTQPQTDDVHVNLRQDDGLVEREQAQPAQPRFSESTGLTDFNTDGVSDAPPASQHHSLKYHLLGPSLTKSGQDGVDQKKVSEIIYNASKGSKYFNNEESKDKVLTEKIERTLAKKRQIEKLDLSSDIRRADRYIEELELTRDLTQNIIHVDCDAFYAAVEELDRPELKNVPFAVGKGVLTTCNYLARQYGCRSAMAGFVAKKLCPELVFIPLSFDKYIAKAKEVREILAVYDARFESASLDEAYLNITDYCREHEMDPQEAVRQLRARVESECKITVSAGIAANARLAKISSNKNKPNGQFFLPGDRTAIMAFMRELPTRKVNGIGRVFERELDAIGVKTCGDIYEHRGILQRLFGEKAFHFLIQTYLGLGRTVVQPSEEYERKSVGTESTFGDLKGHALKDKLKHTAEELERDLQRTEFKGRTLVLKVKLHTYEVLTRQVAPPYAVGSAADLYKYSEPMLAKLEKEIPGMTLRLMGLRCTNLLSTKKVDFFGKFDMKRKSDTKDAKPGAKVDADGWEIWPEEEFEHAAEQEKAEEMEQLEQLSQELQAQGELEEPEVQAEAEEASQLATWSCPVCFKAQSPDERSFNQHIDECLSKQTIKETIREAKRKVPMDEHGKSKQRKLFFH